MKNTNKCPKCGSENVVMHRAEGNNVYEEPYEVKIGLYNVHLDRYLCIDCGYLEAWAAKEYQLDNLREARAGKKDTSGEFVMPEIN